MCINFNAKKTNAPVLGYQWFRRWRGKLITPFHGYPVEQEWHVPNYALKKQWIYGFENLNQALRFIRGDWVIDKWSLLELYRVCFYGDVYHGYHIENFKMKMLCANNSKLIEPTGHICSYTCVDIPVDVFKWTGKKFVLDKTA